MNTLRKIQLPPNFYLNKANHKGLILDALWKEVVVSQHGGVIPPEDDAPYDAYYEGEYHDVKLIPRKVQTLSRRVDAYVYLSHNEYLFGKEHDTRYQIYVEDEDIAEFLISFTFTFAKDTCAFELFPNGKWVHCKASGKDEAPWSINVSHILQNVCGGPV